MFDDITFWSNLSSNVSLLFSFSLPKPWSLTWHRAWVLSRIDTIKQESTFTTKGYSKTLISGIATKFVLFVFFLVYYDPITRCLNLNALVAAYQDTHKSQHISNLTIIIANLQGRRVFCSHLIFNFNVFNLSPLLVTK